MPQVFSSHLQISPLTRHSSGPAKSAGRSIQGLAVKMAGGRACRRVSTDRRSHCISPATICAKANSAPTPLRSYVVCRLPHRRTAQFARSEEHTSELPSLMRNSYAVFCLKTQKNQKNNNSKKRRTRIIETILQS